MPKRSPRSSGRASGAMIASSAGSFFVIEKGRSAARDDGAWSVAPIIATSAAHAGRERRDIATLRASALRTLEDSRHLKSNLVHGIAGRNEQRLRIVVAERDVGRADLLFRLAAENRQIDRAQEFAFG